MDTKKSLYNEREEVQKRGKEEDVVIMMQGSREKQCDW
jgi:hypothetical protein